MIKNFKWNVKCYIDKYILHLRHRKKKHKCPTSFYQQSTNRYFHNLATLKTPPPFLARVLYYNKFNKIYIHLFRMGIYFKSTTKNINQIFMSQFISLTWNIFNLINFLNNYMFKIFSRRRWWVKWNTSSETMYNRTIFIMFFPWTSMVLTTF